MTVSNPIIPKRVQNDREKVDALALEILQFSRDILSVKMRFLNPALSRLEPISSDWHLATDGVRLLYDPPYVVHTYVREKNRITRNYLHLTLHCVFQHFYVDLRINQMLWNISCDMAVENMITDMNMECVKVEREQKQQEVLEPIRKAIGQLTAEKIYHYLLRNRPDENTLIHWWKLFMADDHESWYISSISDEIDGSLLDGAVNQRVDVAARADAAEVRVVPRGAHAVAQEDVEHVILGINPEARAREARVAEGFGCCLGTGVAGVGVADDGFVKTEAAVAVGTLLRREGLDGRCLQQTHATVGAAVEPHLEQLGEVVGIAEQSGIALHTARECRQLVMDIAVDVLPSLVGLLLGVGDFVARELAQRAVHRVIGAQRGEDIVVHIVVERRVRHALHSVGKQREVAAAVQVFLLAQLGVIHAVHHRVVGHPAAPDAVSNSDVELVGLDSREDVGAQLGVLVAP